VNTVLERCCGLDVHKKTVVACSLTPEGKAFRTFGTTTGELLQLVEWLKGAGCSHVAMESTGSYWKPVYNLLEDHFELLVVNARHLKLVPGRKSDVKDAEWIADLLKHGLLRESFIPSREERDPARADALPFLTRGRTLRRGEPHPEGARRRQHQVGFGCLERRRRFR
jgi:transposase